MRAARIDKENKAFRDSACEGAKILEELESGAIMILLKGPEDSAYAGNSYEVYVTRPENYPFSPPAVKFLSNIVHPNISPEGYVCLDILQSNWSPTLSLESIILSVQVLLTEPNLTEAFTSVPREGWLGYLIKENKKLTQATDQQIQKKLASSKVPEQLAMDKQASYGPTAHQKLRVINLKQRKFRQKSQ